LYYIAIEKSISNRAIYKFKAKLTLFNSYYRATKKLLIITQRNKSINRNSNNIDNNNKIEDKKNAKKKKNNKNKII